MRKNTLKLIIFTFVISILTSCASLPKADLSLISKYKSPVSVGEQDTLIYVIRQSTMKGAIYSVWVANNENYVAELSSGQYAYFKVKSGINTVSVKMAGMTFSFKNVDVRPGETVFLFIDFSKDFKEIFYEINNDIGKTLVMDYRESKPINKTEKTTDYLMGLYNPAIYGVNPMKEAKTESEPEPDVANATVTFLRPQDKSGWTQPLIPGIWSNDRFIGNLDYHKRLTIKLAQGKYTFMTGTKFNAFLKADIQAGKKYYIIVDSSWNGTIFVPVKKSEQNNNIQKNITKTSRVELSQDLIDVKIRKRIDETLSSVRLAIDNMGKEESDISVIEATDGR